MTINMEYDGCQCECNDTFLLLVVLNAYELPGEYIDILITHKMVEASVILEYGDKVW